MGGVGRYRWPQRTYTRLVLEQMMPGEQQTVTSLVFEVLPDGDTMRLLRLRDGHALEVRLHRACGADYEALLAGHKAPLCGRLRGRKCPRLQRLVVLPVPEEDPTSEPNTEANS